jgi:hypothetical protein
VLNPFFIFYESFSPNALIICLTAVTPLLSILGASVSALLEGAPVLDEFFQNCQECSFQAREVLSEGNGV